MSFRRTEGRAFWDPSGHLSIRLLKIAMIRDTRYSQKIGLMQADLAWEHQRELVSLCRDSSLPEDSLTLLLQESSAGRRNIVDERVELVEPGGLEPPTSSLQRRRSPS